MKTAELRGMADEQLRLTLSESNKNLFHLRVQSATEKQEAVGLIKRARREIARIQTIMRERELAAATPAGQEKK